MQGRMFKDFKVYLWLLKLGALVNFYFLWQSLVPPMNVAQVGLLYPAQILFIVSAYRCLFPVRYKDNTVFHDSVFSSIFLTRLLATFSEVALIYQFAYLLRILNVAQVGWINVLSWGMVLQVVISQFFVWGTVLTGRLKLFFYEELGWAIIYAANTIASLYLYTTVEDLSGGRELLLYLNLIFGAFYLPWQFLHLRSLLGDADQREKETGIQAKVTWSALKAGLYQSIYVKNPTGDSGPWGGLMGVIWMTGYWASLIPVWSWLIVRNT